MAKADNSPMIVQSDARSQLISIDYPESLGPHTRLGLESLGRPSPSFIVVKSLLIIGIATVSTLILLWVEGLLWLPPVEAVRESHVGEYLPFGVRLAWFGVVASLLYWETYRRTYTVEVNKYRIETTFGVFFKKHASALLVAWANFYIRRDGWYGPILGKYTLEVSAGVLLEKPEWLEIPYLSIEQAEGLRRFITDHIDEQLHIKDLPVDVADDNS